MPKPARVEIVPARRRGVTGYANVGRGTALGNPYRVGLLREIYRDANVVRCEKVRDAAHAVDLYREFFYSCSGRQHEAKKLLDRDWPGGVVRLGCPCNGHEKGEPCHATVIKEFLEAEIERREAR